MPVSRTMRRRLCALAGPVVAGAVLVYFGYHLVEGEHGARAWGELNEKIRLAEIEQQELRTKRLELERKVALLRSGSLDVDLLEELARGMLNFAHPDDIVFRPPDGQHGKFAK